MTLNIGLQIWAHRQDLNLSSIRCTTHNVWRRAPQLRAIFRSLTWGVRLEFGQLLSRNLFGFTPIWSKQRVLDLLRPPAKTLTPGTTTNNTMLRPMSRMHISLHCTYFGNWSQSGLVWGWGHSQGLWLALRPGVLARGAAESAAWQHHRISAGDDCDHFRVRPSWCWRFKGLSSQVIFYIHSCLKELPMVLVMHYILCIMYDTAHCAPRHTASSRTKLDWSWGYVWLHVIYKGEGTVDWATVASNCSTWNCLSNFDKRIDSNSSNWKIWARWGFPTASSPLPSNGMLS